MRRNITTALVAVILKRGSITPIYKESDPHYLELRSNNISAMPVMKFRLVSQFLKY